MVWLVGAKIGGSLDCKRGIFKKINGQPYALAADRAEIQGSVFFKTGFSAEGPVRLFGARIGSVLHCEGGTFSDLNLNSPEVKGTLFWHHVNPGKPDRTRGMVLNLTNAKVGALTDDLDSWPGGNKSGRLSLDGFVYGRITELSRDEKSLNKDYEDTKTSTDAATRINWLERQNELKPQPQPYRQLAKVLGEMGDDDGAKQVLFALEKRSRQDDSGLQIVEDAFSRATVGYGIYPGRAVWWACGLAVVGWIVHRRAGRMGMIAPTDKDAYDEFSKGQMPEHYQPFNPLIYSIENCIPLVKLGQDDLWATDPSPQPRAVPVTGGWLKRGVNSALDWVVPDAAVRPVTLRWFRWIMIALGWLLATFFGAALSGFLKSG